MLVVERSEAEICDSFLLGYVIGLIVGEGSFTGDHAAACLAVKLHADDPEPLMALTTVFGGRVYGPYCHQRRRYRMWLLRGSELFDALPILFRWLPPSKKREQLELWAGKYGYLSRRTRWLPRVSEG